MKAGLYSSILLSALAARVAAQVAMYQQCGGQGWQGPTSCASGAVCACANQWYSQCRPAGNIPPPGPGCPAVGNGNPHPGNNFLGVNTNTLPATQPVYNYQPTNSFSTSYTQNTAQPLIGAGGGGSLDSGTASTTRYGVGGTTSCGCSGSWMTNRADGLYTVALPKSMYNGDYCGSGCGLCYQLTSTGKPVKFGMGPENQPMNSITVMATNVCGTDGQWCVEKGQTNNYGFEHHFDILEPAPPGWDNVIVTYQKVACPAALKSAFQSDCTCKSALAR